MTTPPTPPPKRPSLHLTWEDWLPYLEDPNASDAAKQRLIETLWSIIQAFVDLGWDIDATAESSGQPLDLTAALQAAVLHSEEAPNSQEARTPESEEV